MTGIEVSPYMLDVLLVYAYDQNAAWGAVRGSVQSAGRRAETAGKKRKQEYLSGLRSGQTGGKSC